jgi:hypothetical protein
MRHLVFTGLSIQGSTLAVAALRPEQNTCRGANAAGLCPGDQAASSPRYPLHQSEPIPAGGATVWARRVLAFSDWAQPPIIAGEEHIRMAQSLTVRSAQNALAGVSGRIDVEKYQQGK